MSANSRGLMRFEHTREKVEGDDQNETEPGMWQVIAKYIQQFLVPQN